MTARGVFYRISPQFQVFSALDFLGIEFLQLWNSPQNSHSRGRRLVDSGPLDASVGDRPLSGQSRNSVQLLAFRPVPQGHLAFSTYAQNPRGSGGLVPQSQQTCLQSASLYILLPTNSADEPKMLGAVVSQRMLNSMPTR